MIERTMNGATPTPPNFEKPQQAARRLAAPAIRDGLRPEALHGYADSDGEPMYWRIRAKHPTTGEKWIRPMRLKDGRYVLGEPEFAPGRKPLYRLDELAKADPSRRVFFVEGEKAADALAKIGCLVTTAGGASSDDSADFGPLSGRTVRLWPDNDQAGQDHAERVAVKLRALGCAVEIVDIALLRLPEKGDAVEFLAAHPNATEAVLMALDCIREAVAARDPNGWPIPRPLPSELLPVQAFDFALLPAACRGWLQDAAERFQCAPDYLAVAAMVAAGSVIGRRIAIRPKRRADWTEYGNLWGLIVGRPGAMKSPAMGEATRHLRRFEIDAGKAHADAMREYDAARKRFEFAEGNAKKAAQKSGSADDLLTDAAPQDPVARRFILNDATVEALHLTCRDNPGGFLVLRDEVSGLLRNLDSEEHASDRAFYLQSWSGNDAIVLDRIGRGRNISARVNLSLLGGVQPDRIAGYVRAVVRGGASNDGLLQRFGLLVWPDQSGEWRDVDRHPDTEAKNAAAAAFSRLRDFVPFEVGGEVDQYDGEDAVPYLRFDDGAQDAFDGWQSDLMRDIRSAGLHPAIESHLSKYKKLVPSLALTLHLIGGGIGRVSESALLRALAWSDYLRSHAERLYGSATAREVSCARLILQKLRAGSVEYSDATRRTFDGRTIYRKGWAGLDREGTAEGLELLADLDYVRREIVPAGAAGGRPAELWLVNPEAMR